MPLAPGSCAPADTIRTLPSYRRGTQRRGAIVGCRLTGKDHPSARDSIFPALVWKIHLLHGAQTRLVQNAAITGDAPLLERRGLRPQFQRKKPRGKKMQDHIARGNATRARVRSRVDHVFAAQKCRLARLAWCARVKIGLENLAYNFTRLA